MTTEKGGRQAALFIALMVCLEIPPPRTCEQLARGPGACIVYRVLMSDDGQVDVSGTARSLGLLTWQPVAIRPVVLLWLKRYGGHSYTRGPL